MMSAEPTGMQPACRHCPLDRRSFLSCCAAGIGTLAVSCAGPTFAGSPVASPRVRLVFTHAPSATPTWPNVGYDYESRKKELLAQLRARCPDIELLPETVHDADGARRLLADGTNVDGYLVYLLGIWTGAPQVFASAGQPTVFADDLYAGSGEFLVASAAARRQQLPVVGVATSRIEDIAAVVRCFGTLKQPGLGVTDFLARAEEARRQGIHRVPPGAFPEDRVTGDVAACRGRLAQAKILVVGRPMAPSASAIRELFGTEVVPISFEALQSACDRVDPGQAAAWAQRWTQKAQRVVEPSLEEITRSGAMYVAMRELMQEHGAEAIAINCLGGFYGGHLKAYPCLGFCQLNDDGLVGACEADLDSTITMLAMSYLAGRPGYISDPVIDTSKNQIIYAHCVAPTRPFGPHGPVNPYQIRSHSEDRRGASMRSLLPLGRITSTLRFSPILRETIFHQGVTVENVDEDKACRTKLAASVVGDIDKLLREWDRWGWHRVTFFGDLQEPVAALNAALGMKLVTEA